MSRRLRLWAVWGGLAVVVAAALGVVVASPGDGPRTPAERAHSLAAELRCVECQGLSVADSNSPTAQRMRADIERRIVEERQTDAEIRRAYVDRYGEWILLRPAGGGLDALVWALPVVVIMLGAAGIGVALWRWRRQPRPEVRPGDEELVADLRRTSTPADPAATSEVAATKATEVRP